MMASRRGLIAKYKRLPGAYQKSLEVLSANYRPLARTPALVLLQRASTFGPDGKRWQFPAWKKVVRELLDAEILVESDNRIRCNPLVREHIARSADKKGRLRQCYKAVDSLRYRSAYKVSAYGHYYNQSEELFEDIRKTIYLNQPREFLVLMSIFDQSFRKREPGSDPIQRVFDGALDGDWLATRKPQIQNKVLSEIVSWAHERLIPCDSALDLFRKVVPRESLADSNTQLVIKHWLLQGDLGQAEKWLAGDETSESKCYGGWVACLRGEYERAVELFDTAFRQIKEETRKRQILIPPDMAAFYVVALIATRDGNRIRQAQSYVDLALSKQEEGYLHHALKSAADLADGKTEKAGKLSGAIHTIERIPALDRLIFYTALCWVNRKAAGKHRAAINRLRKAAVKGTYRWVAAQCDELLIRVDRDAQWRQPPPPDHQSLGTVPLLDAVPDEQPWQRSLAALERMSKMVRPGRKTKASKSRLTWRVNSEDENISLEPYQQKQSPSGKWSKGRKVALSRLHGETNRAFMTGHDLRVCQAIVADPSAFRGRVKYSLDVSKALQELAGHPFVFRSDAPATGVEVVRGEPRLEVTTERGTVRIQLVPPPPGTGDVLASFDSPTRLTVTVFDPHHREIFAVIGREGVAAPVVSKDTIVRAVSSVSDLVTVHSDFDSGTAVAKDIQADATPHFHLTPFGDGLRAEPLVRPFAGDGPAYPIGEGGEVVFATVKGRRSRAHRNRDEETRKYQQVLSACPSLRHADWDGSAWTLPTPHECLELLDELQQLGQLVVVAWPKGEALRIKHHVKSRSLYLRIRKKRDWFSIDGKVRIDDGLVIELRELLERMSNATGRFLELGGKEFLALTKRFQKRIEELSAFVDRHGKGLRFHPSQAHALEALIEDAGSVDADPDWDERIRRFREAQALDPDVPSTLQAELRTYQTQGFQWAARLAAWGAGACLADDMGLGKTLQALTVALAHAPSGPTLVVAPTSVCPNWLDETRRFTPTLNAFQFGQGDRAKTIAGLRPFDVMVCSYGLLHQEADKLASVKWETIVLDEAQAIKNRKTKRSIAAMRLQGAFRMITTGTPIENHLGELWNLFQFINPGLLGSADSFAKRFASPIHQRGSNDAKSRLKRLIQPFILRRTKSAVLDELPSRTEITIRVQMPPEERALYEAVRQRAVETLEEANTEGGQGRFRILAEIMKLRRACCHPRLVMPDAGIEGSKLESFGFTVDDLIASGHKALVFSQFVDHLKIVSNHLDQKGVAYRYLDGSTPPRERKRQVDRFQAGEGDLFLISLRAGGQGLNLTAADYVLHLDPWWNPAVEDQASDRAHRIGQTRPVTIYRFVMKDTIEEKIVDLHASKRDLADSLLEGADMSGKMSADELLALIKGS